MHRTARPTCFVILAALLAAVPLAARAQQPADAVPPAEAIDRPLGDLAIESQSLASVLELLAQRAGVTLAVDEDTYGVLPWGRETRLATVRIEGASLRKALDEILGPLGLTYAVGDRSISIQAGPPLRRLNRRATWNDLHLLQMLGSTDYTPDGFAQLRIQYRITSKVNAPQMLRTQIDRVGSGSLLQVLSAATNALGWTWFPNDDHVVVLSAQAHTAHKLARAVTARYNQMGLAHILLDLAAKADVALFLEPGIMLRLPPSTAQSYTLLLQQTTVRQALELICAETGLSYEIKRDGLYVTLPPSSTEPGAAGAPRRGDPYVAKVSVPSKDGGYSYEFLLRESELPADIREYRGQLLDAILERMRQDMAPAGETSDATLPPAASAQ